MVTTGKGSESAVLELRNIKKEFPGVLALDGVDFNLKPGEVHVLLGENGAGKSTLIKVISGAYKKDEGKIFIDGSLTEIYNPRHAQELGVATVYQELNLIPFLSAGENIYLGRQPLRRGVIRTINRSRMNRDAYAILKSLEMEDAITAVPDFDAVVCQNDDMMMGAIQAIQSAGIDPADVVITGYDGVPDGLRAVRDGLADCTLQYPIGQAPEALGRLVNYLKGEAPAEKDFEMSPWIITKDNLETGDFYSLIAND